MNLIVDENVDKLIVDTLRQDGHNVLYVAEFAPSKEDIGISEMSKVWQDLISSGYRIDVHNKSKDYYIDYDNDGRSYIQENFR